MPKRRKWLVPLAGAVLAIAAATFLTRDNEPRYQGRTLSYWLNYQLSFFPWPSGRQESYDAIRNIGTNALPYLVKWIQYDPPTNGIRVAITRLIAKMPVLRRVGWLSKWISVDRQQVRAEEALRAFQILGPAGEGAIGDLTRLVNQSKHSGVAGVALYALGSIGTTNVLPALVVYLTNEDELVRMSAAGAMSGLGTNASPGIQLLVDRLKDTNAAVAQVAGYTLGQLKLAPEIVVPGLIDALNARQVGVQHYAARALEQYGAAARTAIPALLQALQSPNETQRHWATNALLKIAPEVLTNSTPQ